jgi:WD40 repeat protein
VVGIAVSGGTSLNTIGFDDTLRTFDSASGQYGGAAVSLSAQPRGIEQHGDLTFLVTLKSIVMLKGGSVEQEVGVEFEPSCCSYSSSHQHLAVGEVSGNTVRIYSTNAGMDLVKEITLTGATMDVAYSPDQKYLVTADSNRKVTLFSAGGGYDKPNNREWGFHTAKVNCVAWAPNSLYVASGGLDTSIILWSVEAPDKHCIIRNAHDQSQITNVAWLDNSSLVSTGQDANIKIWNISWPN